MIGEVSLKKIAQLTGVDEKALKDAITSDEVQELEIGDMEVFTPDGFEDFKVNFAKEQKSAGAEIAVKELKRELELDFTGKSVKGLYEAAIAKGKAEAGVEPNKRITELEKATEQYIKDLETKESELNTLKGNYERGGVRQTLIGSVTSTTKIPVADIVALYELKNDWDKDESGNLVAKKMGGEVLKDKYSKPISLTDHFAEFASTYVDAGSKKPVFDPAKVDELKFSKKSEYDTWKEANPDVSDEIKSAVLARSGDNKEFFNE